MSEATSEINRTRTMNIPFFVAFKCKEATVEREKLLN